MDKPTKVLNDEHQNILKVITAMENECNELEKGKELNKDFFLKSADFIRNYADKFHHAKEEEILFVELCKDTVEMHCNPIEQMLHEHEEGRNFVKGMVAALESDDKEQIIKNARGYTYLLQDHIYKEDSILYPMADESLSSEVQDLIKQKFIEAEKQKFNEEFKKKYLTIINELQNG